MINKNFKKIFYNVNNFFNSHIKTNKKIEILFLKNKINILDLGAIGIIENNKFNLSSNNKIVNLTKIDYENDKDLNSTDIYIDDLLWSEEVEKNFYITSNKISSSLFKPNNKEIRKYKNYKSHEIKEIKKVKTKTIQNLEKIKKIDFVKIDVEGAELEILRGMGDKLNDVIGVEIESQYIERYLGSPLFNEVHNFLLKNKFELYLVNNETWLKTDKFNSISNHKLVWGDFLYFKKTEILFNDDIPVDKRNDNLNRLIYMLIFYKFYDESNFIVKEYSEKYKLSSESQRVLLDFIDLNIESNIIIFLKKFFKLIFAFIIYSTSFFTSYRKAGSLYFKKSFSEFFLILSNIFKFSDKVGSVIRDSKL